nr:hypothetical protein [Streptomyces sp. MA5143a]
MDDGRREVERLRRRRERNALVLGESHDLREVDRRARKAVDLEEHDHVQLGEPGQDALQARPVEPAREARDIDVLLGGHDLLAACLAQRLTGRALAFRRSRLVGFAR